MGGMTLTLSSNQSTFATGGQSTNQSGGAADGFLGIGASGCGAGGCGANAASGMPKSFNKAGEDNKFSKDELAQMLQEMSSNGKSVGDNAKSLLDMIKGKFAKDKGGAKNEFADAAAKMIKDAEAGKSGKSGDSDGCCAEGSDKKPGGNGKSKGDNALTADDFSSQSLILEAGGSDAFNSGAQEMLDANNADGDSDSIGEGDFSSNGTSAQGGKSGISLDMQTSFGN
jgi:hypothetical protein